MRATREKGFTIVELIVTLALASIVLGLAYQVFIAQRRGYSTQNDVAEMQQNARIAIDELSRNIRNIGNGVSDSQHQLLYCGPFEMLFNGDLDSGLGPVTGSTAINSVYQTGTSIYTPPGASFSGGAEMHLLGMEPVAGTNHFTLVHKTFWSSGSGSNMKQSELALEMAQTDASTNEIAPLFKYWGEFDNDASLDLWGDTNGNGQLDPSELPGLTPITDSTLATHLAGLGLGIVPMDNAVRRIEVQVLAETESADKGYSANSGYRQRVVTSAVTPRNLWACPLVSTSTPTVDLTTTDVVPVPLPPASPPVSTSYTYNVVYNGLPEQGRTVLFDLKTTSTDPAALAAASLSATFGTTDVNGNVTATINWAGNCPDLYMLLVGGSNLSYTLTATIGEPPSLVTPFGTCAPTSVDTAITLKPGVPDHLEIVEPPNPPLLSTCNASTTFVTQVQDICNIPVNLLPGDHLTFTASDLLWNALGSVTPSDVTTSSMPTLGTVTTASGTYVMAVAATYNTPASGGSAWTAPRTGDNFNVELKAQASVSFSDFKTSVIELEPRPATIKLPPLSNISSFAHTDCPTGPQTETFNIVDCHGNLVYNLGSDNVDVSYLTDATGPPTDGEQGFPYPDDGSLAGPPISSYASYPLQITATNGSLGLGVYGVTYAPPTCTLAYNATIHPTIQLSPTFSENTGAPAETIGFSVDSCTGTCGITATPTFIDSGICSSTTTTQATTIMVGSCDIPDGTTAELEVVNTGLGGDATWDLSGATMTTNTTGIFSGGLITKTLYKGNAVTGDKLTIRVYQPSKALYQAGPYASSPPTFMCEGIDLVTLDSSCNSIHVSNRSFQDIGVSSTQTLTQDYPNPASFSSGDKLFIEVFDCDENADSAVPDTIEVTVTSPQGYSPPAPDIETVTLTETGPDTGIFRNDANPLPILYCAIPLSGDISGNGRLFVRTGYDITVQYTDNDDATDNNCILAANIESFSCDAFDYSYFAQNYIHLDRHGVSANLTVGGNVWTNGEFELSSDMLADARGPDKIYGTGDDDAIVALGHLSNGGRIFGDVYAPSYDAFGPDGAGQNTQNFGTHVGTITGDIHLRDGFRFDPPTSSFSVEIIGDAPWEKTPSYGAYASRAASDVATAPPGSGVIVHPIAHSPAITGSVFTNYSSGAPLYNPNMNGAYAQDPPLGEVLVAKDLPTFDLLVASNRALNMMTDYHAWALASGVNDGIDSDTYFTSTAEFEAFVLSTNGKTFTAADGTSYTSGDNNVLIIGDHLKGTVFYVNGDLDFTAVNLGGKQLVVNGALVATRRLSIKGGFGGMAIYGCGERPVNWRLGWTGTTYVGTSTDADPYADMNWWFSDRGGPEAIPYSIPALIGMYKVEVKDRTQHTMVGGIVYSPGEIHFHNSNPAGKAFLVGAEIGNIIHNCLYMEFEYNTCVKASAAEWYGCFCDTGGAPVACSLSLSPSAATVTQGGASLGLTATATAGSPTIIWSLLSASGGSLSSTLGSSSTFKSGAVTGSDVVTITDLSGACLPDQAIITVIGSCQVTATPTTTTIPVGQSGVFSASSTGGGPFTWMVTQNESGGSPLWGTGNNFTYTAGLIGGTDKITVTDASGCTQAQIVITVDSCFVTVDSNEYNGVACTASPTNNIAWGGVACVAASGGSGDLHWFSDDPNGLFSFNGGITWEAGSSTAFTLSSSTSGSTILYKAGTSLGTYGITAEDTESCQGNQILTTCGMSLDPLPASVYFNDPPLNVSVSNPTFTPVSFSTDLGSMSPTSATTAVFTPEIGLPGKATITAIDAVACTATGTIDILAPPICNAAGTVMPSSEVNLMATGISNFQTGLDSACFGTGPFRIQMTGPDMNWIFDVSYAAASGYTINVVNKMLPMAPPCVSTNQTVNDMKTLGIFNAYKGLDLLAYKSGSNNCSLSKALSLSTQPFSISINHHGSYVNCKGDTCGGWYELTTP